MSYTIDLVVIPLSSDDKVAWAEIDDLRERYDGDDRIRSEKLVKLHEILSSKYPCLSSYEDEDDIEECPWADGPMIENFAHEMGMLAILTDRVDEVLPFIISKTNSFGITVADGQNGSIHRPVSETTSNNSELVKKPWWQFW